MKTVNVAILTSINKTLSYNYYEEASIGDLIEVKILSRKIFAIVLSTSDLELSFKPKDIERVVIKKFFNDTFLSFINHFAKYNMSNLNDCFSLCVNKNVESCQAVEFKDCKKSLIDSKKDIKKLEPNNYRITNELFQEVQKKTEYIKTHKLNSSQEEVFNSIFKKTEKHFIDLVYGVTGSGKTEVFLHIVNRTLEQNPDGQVLIMLPEIMLVENLILNIKDRIACDYEIWHSSEGSKAKSYVNITSGKAKIIFGTRSAMMLKYANLKAIIIDEEHDDSYKQTEGVFYHARDMAILRGFYEKFPIFLFSATPSIESMYNVFEKKYNFHKLTSKFFDSARQLIEFTDKPYDDILSLKSLNLIQGNFKNGFQTMILFNKRGYSNFLFCQACQEVKKCENCDIGVCYHKKQSILKCHYCLSQQIATFKCDKCGSHLSESQTFGIEKFCEVLAKKLPDLKVQFISSDTVSSKKSIHNFISEMKDSKVDVIVGTKMISKGFHFSNLKSTIIIDYNLAISDDFRADERLMQLILQAAGRAGREAIDGGNVIIEAQKINPKLKTFIENSDFIGFAKYEIVRRKSQNHIFCLPPFVKEIELIISTDSKEKLIQTQNLVKFHLNELEKTYKKDFQILKTFGPIDYFLAYLNRKFRSKFIIRFDKSKNLQTVLLLHFEGIKLPTQTQIRFDVDAR